jgi:hypothetical protein
MVLATSITKNPHIPTTEKKSPMPKNVHNRSTVMNLINEALSRTRMRSPQNNNSEAPRPARRIAIEARRQHALELGDQVFTVR